MNLDLPQMSRNEMFHTNKISMTMESMDKQSLIQTITLQEVDFNSSAINSARKESMTKVQEGLRPKKKFVKKSPPRRHSRMVTHNNIENDFQFESIFEVPTSSEFHLREGGSMFENQQQ